MKRLIENLTGGYSSSAKVVDGKLILSFPDAVKPVIWQMDIGHAKVSSLEVEEEGGGYVLALKTPKGERHVIAPFGSRAKALKALMSVSRAMEQAQGRLAPANDGSAAAGVRRGGRVKQFLSAVVGVILLLFLISVFMSAAPPTRSFGPDSFAEKGPGDHASSGGGDATGVPMSAEEFLRDNR